MLSPEEVCRFLNLGDNELKKLVSEGRLNAYRIGGTFIRYEISEVAALKQALLAPQPKPASLSQPGNGSRAIAEKSIKAHGRLDLWREWWYDLDVYVVVGTAFGAAAFWALWR